MDDYKQVIVMRKDLGMRKGKMIAQGAHASMKVVLENFEDPRVIEWLSGSFTKIVVSVDSEQELHDVMENAHYTGVLYSNIIDQGRTEFNGKPTLTCAAFGPDTKENLDKITGHLKLL